MKKTEVLAIYENTSEKLLNIFEKFCDYFRLSCGSSYTSSPSNNVYANLTQQRFKQTIISAKVCILLFLQNKFHGGGGSLSLHHKKLNETIKKFAKDLKKKKSNPSS